MEKKKIRKEGSREKGIGREGNRESRERSKRYCSETLSRALIHQTRALPTRPHLALIIS